VDNRLRFSRGGREPRTRAGRCSEEPRARFQAHPGSSRDVSRVLRAFRFARRWCRIGSPGSGPQRCAKRSPGARSDGDPRAVASSTLEADGGGMPRGPGDAGPAASNSRVCSTASWAARRPACEKLVHGDPGAVDWRCRCRAGCPEHARGSRGSARLGFTRVPRETPVLRGSPRPLVRTCVTVPGARGRCGSGRPVLCGARGRRCPFPRVSVSDAVTVVTAVRDPDLWAGRASAAREPR